MHMHIQTQTQACTHAAHDMHVYTHIYAHIMNMYVIRLYRFQQLPRFAVLYFMISTMFVVL